MQIWTCIIQSIRPFETHGTLHGTCCRSDTPITRDLPVWGSSGLSLRCLTLKTTAKQVGEEEVFPSSFLLDMALCCQLACQTKLFGPSKWTLFFFPWSLTVQEYCRCHVVLVRWSLQHKEKCWIMDCCQSPHCQKRHNLVFHQMRAVCHPPSVIGEITECKKVQKIFWFCVCEQGVSRLRFHTHTMLTFTTDPTERNAQGFTRIKRSHNYYSFIRSGNSGGTHHSDVLTQSWIFKPTGHALLAKMDVTVLHAGRNVAYRRHLNNNTN